MHALPSSELNVSGILIQAIKRTLERFIRSNWKRINSFSFRRLDGVSSTRNWTVRSLTLWSISCSIIFTLHVGEVKKLFRSRIERMII